ncbi:uncharacterized mitochondrial protein AtMg00810-like [Phragmites australis]|uniref:uncharacterized mitochondrial protein AtMg00810-like n=1 Tax=Phragmites australis TaxID=29695 RepID=UPI002D78A6BC|nr:uncharacterized mitochondrial protein AtMg00810-like [Phragmites australis]
MAFLLYIDDMILTLSTSSLLQWVIGQLKAEIAMKDLGPLHYFLRIQVTRSSGGLFLSQANYALDLLEHVLMKGLPTLVFQEFKSSIGVHQEHADTAVGVLEYLFRVMLTAATDSICSNGFSYQSMPLAYVSFNNRMSPKISVLTSIGIGHS